MADPVTSALLKEAGVAAPRATGNPAPIRFTPAEEADNAADVRSPESRAALEKELGRNDLHPRARAVLKAEFDQHFGNQPAPVAAPRQEAANDPVTAGLLAEASGSVAPEAPKAPSFEGSGKGDSSQLFNPVTGGGRVLGSMVAAPGAAILGGWRALGALATGGTLEDAARAAQETSQAVGFEPRNAGERTVAGALASPYNPLNWLGEGANWAGGKTTDIATQLGASPEIAAGAGATVNTAIQAAPLLLLKQSALEKPVFGTGPALPTVKEITPAITDAGLDVPTYLRRKQSGAQKLSAAAEQMPEKSGLLLTEKASTAAPQKIDLGLSVPKAGTIAEAIASEPIKGGLPVAVQTERSAVLQRLGIKNAWKSAVEGNAQEGAVNAQVMRFKGSPAAQAAEAQFAHETQAIKNATSQIAAKAGGTLGEGQTANLARGTPIADLGDRLRTHFDKAETRLYEIAHERTKGLPVVSMEPVDALLKDRSFKNTIMAQDKGHLLSAIDDQLAAFKENNPAGLTVRTAEEFRQWLNQQWSPTNSKFIGQVKGAVDKAVTRAAGEDVYKASRDMHILKKATLENPKGINRLWDVDPQTPTNRAVKIEALATEAEKMSVAHFKELVDTIRTKVPPELKAQAQNTEAQLKAHFVQGVLDAGTPSTKTPSPFWNNRKVNEYIAANEEKMKILFSKEEQARLADIRAGGNIIAVDASYPGAAAQAEIAMKQGMLGRIIAPVMTSAGGGVGAGVGALFGSPAQGGMLGAAAGRYAGEKMSASAAERSALKKMQQRVVPLNEARP